MKKVFLGGTCNDSKWRNELIPLLEIDYFNPLVPIEEWNEACMAKEIEERNNSDYNLYCITPKMTGVLSIAEVTDDSNKYPKKTLLCVLEFDGENKFSASQMKSLNSVMNIVKNNGAHVFNNLNEVAEFLNRMK